MARLLQRRSVQQSLEAAEKEMGGRSMSLQALQELMAEAGALGAAEGAALPASRRIASDARARFVYLSASASAAPDDDDIANLEDVADAPDFEIKPEENSKNDFETSSPTLDVENASLSELIPETKPFDIINKYFEEYSDDETTEDDGFHPKYAPEDFIFENSGLTQEQILALIKDQSPTAKPFPLDQPSTSGVVSIKSGEMENLKRKTLIENQSVSSRCLTVNEETSNTKLKNDSKIDLDVVKSIIPNSIINDPLNKSSLDLTNTEVEEIKIICTKQNSDEFIRNTEFMKADKMPLQSSSSDFPSNKLVPEELINQSKTNSSLTQRKGIFKQIDTIFVENNPEKTSQQSTLLNSDAQSEGNISDEKDESSDDEEFVEVESSVEPLIAKMDPSPFNEAKSPMEVVIQTGLKDLEEDIFADVFEPEHPMKSKNPVSSQQESAVMPIKVKDAKESNHSVSNKTVREMEKPVEVKSSNNSHDDIFHENVVISEAMEADRANSPSTDDMTINSEYTDPESEHFELELTGTYKEKETNADAKKSVTLTKEQVAELESSLQEESSHLLKAQAKDERLAASITGQMVQDAQELLRLFGIPYVVAPMEAEAQCAFLDHSSLTDGTITDDSDIWLFGGQKVYKNFFDQKKHVLQFRDIDILQHFKLSRSQLVLLALLVGSDYTTGLPGVGPVTALEILAAFPTKSKQGAPEELVDGLRTFREWFTSGSAGSVVKAKLKNKLKDLELSREFPNISVVEAYMSPQVDESMEKFSWGTPDVDSIKEFAQVKFGWPTAKTHEILQPIMKKLNIKISQLTIESYFQPKPTLPKGGGTLSKRVQDAIDKIGEASAEGRREDATSAKMGKNAEGSTEIDRKTNKRKREDAIVGGKQQFASSSAVTRGRGRGRGINKCEKKTNVGAKTASDVPTSFPGNSLPACSKLAGGSKPFPCSGTEFIPQREKDKLNMLKNRLKAIEIFRKSARGLDKTKRDRKKKRTILSKANLSESSDGSGDD